MTVSSDPTSALRQVRTRVIAAIEDVGGVQATAAHFSTLWVPNMSSGSCGEGVFVDDAAEPVVSADPNVVEVDDGCGERSERRGLVKGAVRPVLVVVSLVFAQDVS